MTSTEEVPSGSAVAIADNGDVVVVIEEEEDKGDELIVKPWDPKHIRITTKNFTVREIFTQMEEGDLDLAPDFQRSFVWKDRQQIRLIESILLGIPLPAFYFNQDALGAHQVVDGVQRLTTIKLFMSGTLQLDGNNLEYLKSLQGLVYSTLDAGTRRRFAGTQIVAHVIEPQTPEEVKYDIFNRVNTGGSPLTAQEIRHCMSKEQSRNFLKSLITRVSFDKATGYAFWNTDPNGALARDNRRMSDREMALRFCAFREVPINEYEQFTSLDAFLLEYTRRIDHPLGLQKPPDLTALEKAFERAMINCGTILEEAAFRRWPPGASRRGPINRAIFESQALALADYSLEELLPHKQSVIDAFRGLFQNSDYDDAVRAGTGDPRKVERRLTIPRNAMSEIMR